MSSSVASPPAAVLAAFGVTADPVALPGGKGGTWRAGQVVVKPVEFPAETLWRAEVLSELPDSTQFRVARPVQTRDGAWIAEGWEACQLVAGEPDVRRQDDVLRAGIATHEAAFGPAGWTPDQIEAYRPVVSLAVRYTNRRRDAEMT